MASFGYTVSQDQQNVKSPKESHPQQQNLVEKLLWAGEKARLLKASLPAKITEKTVF